MRLEKGRPQNFTERLEKEQRVYQLLDELKISYERIDHRPLKTMADAREVDDLLQAAICKNLLLCTHKKEAYYLLVIVGDKKFKSGEIARQIESSRLSFASPEEMAALLDLTPGAVSVMGLMNDHEHRVQLLIDEALLSYEYVGCHPCVNTTSLRLKVTDLLQNYLEAVEHPPIFVEVGKTL